MDVRHFAGAAFYVFSILCLAILVAGLRLSPLSFRLFSVYALLLLIGALRSPVIFGPKPLWYELLIDSGARYYFFPTLVFLWAAVYCAFRSTHKVVRYTGYSALALLAVGSLRNWEYAALPDYHFARYVRVFEEAKPGGRVTIPIPPSPNWTVVLVKH